MIIQKAELKDAKRLLEVQKIAFEKYALKYGDFDNNPYHMELDRMEFNIRYRFGQYFKVVENEQIIGGIFGFELDDPKIIKIAQFYLLPEFQALGYGTEILEYFIEQNKVANTWYIDTILQEEYNVNFYKKLNFEIIDEEVEHEGLTFVTMIKKLNR
jgi:GNAT superfamily N-acetyltransferase